jgi:GDP-L-fucose synthase
MNLSAKIYVAGHRGLVGSALVRHLSAQGYANLMTCTHAELDLTEQMAVEEFFARERPEFVFLAAAKVGGIHANNTYPAEFIRDNLAIQTNIIHAAWKQGVKRLLFLGSNCIYPKRAPQPLKEEYLLTAPLEPTNRPYAVAKIAGIEMCWSYNRQYSTQFLAVMPTNLFGPGDHYHPENSHVIPALIRKFHEAKLNHYPTVTVWGTGTPRREFLYSDDLANACVFLMNLPDESFQTLLWPAGNSEESSHLGLAPLVNIGVGKDQTIRELAEMIKVVVGYSGEIVFDDSKADGTPQKQQDVSRLQALGWRADIELQEGLSRAYADFLTLFG